MDIRDELSWAIQSSKNEDHIAHVTLPFEEVLETLLEEGYEFSYVEDDDGIDIWGWNDSTHEDQMSWRLWISQPKWE